MSSKTEATFSPKVKSETFSIRSLKTWSFAGWLMRLSLAKSCLWSLRRFKPFFKSPVANRQRWQHQQVERSGGHQPTQNDQRHWAFDLAARFARADCKWQQAQRSDQRRHQNGQ